MPIILALQKLTAEVVGQNRGDYCHKCQNKRADAVIINRQQVDYAEKCKKPRKSVVLGCFCLNVSFYCNYRPSGGNMIKSILVYPKYVWVTAKGKLGDLKQIARSFSEEICPESRLFSYNGCWLAVKLESCTLAKALGKICEHSDRVYIGYVMPQVLSEHTHIIFENDAVAGLSSVGEGR